MSTEATVREFCRANLTGYKQPRIVEFRTDLPKTPVGKILRRELSNKTEQEKYINELAEGVKLN